MEAKRRPMVHLLGFPVYIDVSWLFVVALITWSLANAAFPRELPGTSTGVLWAMGFAGAIALFASILLHEMSHAIVARRYAIPIRGITLWMFGGVSEMQGEPPGPKAEAFIAAAGPLTSVLLGLFFWFGTAATRNLFGVETSVVFAYLAWGNFALAVFNMLPAFPLDGGRVLRAVLWSVKGDYLWGTRVAARLGRFLGVLLIALGVVAAFGSQIVSAVWLGVLGFLLRSSAQRSYDDVLTRSLLKDIPVSRFMTTDPVTVRPDLHLDRFVEEVAYQHHHKLYPVAERDKLRGAVRTDDLRRFKKEQWKSHTVRDIMVPCDQDLCVDVHTGAVEALQAMSGRRQTRMIVTDGKRLAGVLSLKDLMDHIALKMELDDEGKKRRWRGRSTPDPRPAG